jgi:hypothetical protein
VRLNDTVYLRMLAQQDAKNQALREASRMQIANEMGRHRAEDKAYSREAGTVAHGLGEEMAPDDYEAQMAYKQQQIASQQAAAAAEAKRQAAEQEYLRKLGFEGFRQDRITGREQDLLGQKQLFEGETEHTHELALESMKQRHSNYRTNRLVEGRNERKDKNLAKADQIQKRMRQLSSGAGAIINKALLRKLGIVHTMYIQGDPEAAYNYIMSDPELAYEATTGFSGAVEAETGSGYRSETTTQGTSGPATTRKQALESQIK